MNSTITFAIIFVIAFLLLGLSALNLARTIEPRARFSALQPGAPEKWW